METVYVQSNERYIEEEVGFRSTALRAVVAH